MTTRADFYVGRGQHAEWIGSISCDGYPESGDTPHGVPRRLLDSKDKSTFRAEVENLMMRDDATRPEQGWPWSWTTSHMTDYAYAFDQGQVWMSFFGSEWQEPVHSDDELDDCQDLDGNAFPNMSARRNYVLPNNPRSGALICSLLDIGKLRGWDAQGYSERDSVAMLRKAK